MKKLLIVVAICLVAVLLIGNITKQEPTEWAEYVVQSGDTVCGISISIKPDGIDYREVEHYILQKNNIEKAMIQPGQTILVPVYE